MFSLRDLHFAPCSRRLNVLGSAQRIVGFFYLNYPQINEVGKCDDYEYEWNLEWFQSTKSSVSIPVVQSMVLRKQSKINSVNRENILP